MSRACAFCSEAEVEWHVSEEAATRAVRRALPHVNEALDTLRRLFLLESLSDALKVHLRCSSAAPPLQSAHAARLADRVDVLSNTFVLLVLYCSLSLCEQAGFALWVLSTLGAYFNLLSLLLVGIRSVTPTCHCFSVIHTVDRIWGPLLPPLAN